MDKAITLRRMLVTGASLAALAASTPAAAQAVIEELVVTAQKREEALQDVPIAVSAFNQEALEKAKIDGGPNLVLAVPNVNFSKGNFTGYNFQIRGIGSKLVAASGDAGTGIHLNNAPLIANNLFETEFYDMERVEVLRGPQGTLYGRNATGGVVNLITAKPTDSFQANARAEYGNYNSIKLRGMVNMPLGDMLALRVAGNYLKRDGYGENLATGNDADDRDLWGARATLSFSPTDNFRSWLLFDHFEEDDNRSRIGKQLCTKDLGPANIGGLGYSTTPGYGQIQRGFFTQGCSPTSLYDASTLGTVNSQGTLGGLFGALGGFQTGDAYAGKVQDPDVRNIESLFDPIYKSKTDIYEFNAEFDVTENVTMNWLSAYTYYKLYTRQDYNRYLPSTQFNTAPNPCNLFAPPCSPNPVAQQVPAPLYAGLYATLFPGGVVNAASFTPGTAVAPGSIVSVFGRNLSSADNHASRLPLDTTLGGITLSIGERAVPLFFSGTGQINAQLPFELAPGSRPQVLLRSRRDPAGLEAITLSENITVAGAQPGIFTTNQPGSAQGVIRDAQAAALRLLRREDFLPYQYLLIFGR